MITGDYIPFANADVCREVTAQTTTPIRTGEQIHLRQNYKALIEGHAVNVIGPHPCDVGGIGPEVDCRIPRPAWHRHGSARHGKWDLRPCRADSGLRHAARQLHRLRIPGRFGPFWYEITEGFDGVPLHNGMIDVPDRPGMGVNLIPEAARAYLSEGDADFLD